MRTRPVKIRELPVPIVLVFVASCHRAPAVTVGAAISLKEAFDSLPLEHVSKVYGASGDLAVQMEHGSLEVLASAGPEPRLSTAADEACTLAWNTLVLVVHRGSPAVSWTTLDQTPTTFRLAIGATPQVPAGVYAESALRKIGVWSAVEPKTVRGVNVRNVLDLVARGEADAGIVYATDLHVRKDVDLAGEVPASARPDVRYPLYVSHGASPASRAVAASLCTDATRHALAAFGFLEHAP